MDPGFWAAGELEAYALPPLQHLLDTLDDGSAAGAGWGFSTTLPAAPLAGWTPGEMTSEPEIAVSAAVLEAMAAYFPPGSSIWGQLLEGWIAPALEWLGAQREVDGGFGPEGGSRVAETALVYLAARRMGVAAGDPDLAAAMDAFLLPGQELAEGSGDRGSWSADAFATALALRALVASGLAVDTDGDGVPDADDLDRDGDGVPDIQDAFPIDAARMWDRDRDGIADRDDVDEDGDGFCNPGEPARAGVCQAGDLFALDANAHADLDGDGVADAYDSDRDGDSISDVLDALPREAGDWRDTDGDGLGDGGDADDDGDGIADELDPCPTGPESCVWRVRGLARNARSPLIEGRRIVYMSTDPEAPGLRVHELSTGETRLVAGTSAGEILAPVASGDDLIWGFDETPGATQAHSLYHFDGASVELLASSAEPLESWAVSRGAWVLCDGSQVLFGVFGGGGPPIAIDSAAPGGLSDVALAGHRVFWRRGDAILQRDMDVDPVPTELRGPSSWATDGAFAVDPDLDGAGILCTDQWSWEGSPACWAGDLLNPPSLQFVAWDDPPHEVVAKDGMIALTTRTVASDVRVWDGAAGRLIDIAVAGDSVDHRARLSDRRVVWLREDAACVGLDPSREGLGDCQSSPARIMAFDLEQRAEFQLTNDQLSRWRNAGAPSLSGRTVVWDTFDHESGEWTVEVAALFADVDSDWVADDVDNCLLVPNGAQRDTDFDGYGNRCDMDYDQDGSVAMTDWEFFYAQVASANPDPLVDADGDGFVAMSDYDLLLRAWGVPPGPSGLGCAGSAPCPAPRPVE